MSLHSVFYPKRSFIKIKGEDKEKFLQGLVTNDISNLAEDKLVFACFLTANGRFLYDFFIWQYEDCYLLEISSDLAEDLLKKLRFYKIRLDVTLEIIEDYKVALIFPPVPEDCQNILLQADDPRKENFLTRVILQNDQKIDGFAHNVVTENDYDLYRISNLIAEGEKDLEVEKSIILEFAYDKQNAVSFTKGCYLGQELITRTYRLGVIRKSLQSFTLKNAGEIELPYIVSKDGKKVASLTSCAEISAQEKLYLALVKDGYKLEEGDITDK